MATGVVCLLRVSTPQIFTVVFLVKVRIYVFCSIKRERNDRINIAFFKNEIFKLFIVDTIHNSIGNNHKSLFTRFNARTIHSINKPSIPIALIEKYFLSSSCFASSSFKLLLLLITYGGLIRIKSNLSSIGLANVPKIELACN